MSGSSRGTYESKYSEVRDSLATPKGKEERKTRVEIARREVAVKAELPRPTKKDTHDLYDARCVKNRITRPKAGVAEINVVAIDNSGSNKAIADHVKASSEYLNTGISSIAPNSQTAYVYFSDHCDGSLLMQEVEFVPTGEEGDKILYSTTYHVRGANGGDEPEAIECVLKRVCEIDFGDAKIKRLYLVTDVVGHGMGMSGDGGCPHQQNWRKSVELVRKTFDSFEVIGCGADQEVSELQKQFLTPDRVALDLIDLSAIRETRHRQAITANALLFLMARHQGPQMVQMFLSTLYEKWLGEPQVFKEFTDSKAREMIRRFLKYIDLPQEKVEKMGADILVD